LLSIFSFTNKKQKMKITRRESVLMWLLQKQKIRVGCWWLMPITLATQEAVIRRITA
jgi:hypothetical protein